MQLKPSWTFYHAHSALGPVMDSVRLSPLLLLFCSCLGSPSWHFPHWLCLPLVLSWSLRLDSWSQLARSGSSLPSVVTRALAGVLMVVICHFAANQGQAMHPLELILQLSCLRTVLFGFKNSRQQRTTKTLTGLFCSQITLPDPFSAIPSCVPRREGKFGGQPASIMQLWMFVQTEAWYSDSSQEDAVSHSPSLFLGFLCCLREKELKLFYGEREILVPEAEKLDPVNQGAEMRSSGISFSTPWLSFLLSWFLFQEGFSPMGACWPWYL